MYKLSPVLFLLLSLAGCVVIPGTHLEAQNKRVVNTGQFDINRIADIYPITPKLISLQRKAPIIGRPNVQLELNISAYEYRVGIGDILNITVWDHPALTIPAGSHRSTVDAGHWVHADGTIFFPYIGSLSVLNKTLIEIRKDIIKRLAEFIENPQVDVNVAAFRSQKVYISGEVGKPGTLPINNVPMTLLDAINRAGGLTVNADWERVVLTRRGEKYPVSLQAILAYGDLAPNRLLEHGDMLYVPRNDGQKVFVLGEVSQPATLSIGRDGITLTEALSRAYGLDQRAADATGVFVLRPSRQFGKKSAIYQLDLSDASAHLMGAEFALQPYDVIYVSAAPVARWERVMGQLLTTVQEIDMSSEVTKRIYYWSTP
ncbi:MAG: polysaccharide export protein [Aeromonas sp.]